MKSTSMLNTKRLQAAKPAQRTLLWVAACMLALNCAAAPMEVGDATTPNAGVLLPTELAPSTETEDATTPNAGMLMRTEPSQSARSAVQQDSAPWPDQDASTQTAPPDTAAEDDLDTLRHAAAMGDTVSGLQLVQDLVNRYESSGGNDYLYEAMLWIDRFHSSDLIAHSPLVGHLASTRCTHQVVRYHWLCEKAE